MHHWCKGVLAACKQSGGSLQPHVLIDGNTKVFQAILGEAVPHTVLSSDDIFSELQWIKHNLFDFDGILLLGEDSTVERAATWLHAFCLTFAKPPYLLDIWMLQTAVNGCKRIDFNQEQSTPSVTVDEDTQWPFLPSFETYYQRYEPYTGRYTNAVYQSEKMTLLVPLFFYYHTQGHNQFTMSFFSRLGRLVRKNKSLCVLLMPMSPRADRLKLFWHSDSDNYIWLDKVDGRDQALSLMDKVSGVLTLDNTALLLPLLLEKQVYRDMKCFLGLTRYLPKVTDWIAGKVDFARYVMLRKHLVNHFLNYVIIPPQYEALLQICSSFQKHEKVAVNTARLWSLNRCYSSMAAQRSSQRPNIWLKKMRKFKRDPYAFCKDSTFPLVHSARWLFTPLPELFSNNRQL
jgi:hypothetical protein